MDWVCCQDGMSVCFDEGGALKREASRMRPRPAS
jgi:hypothetical protein